MRNISSEIIKKNPWLDGVPNNWGVGPIKYGFNVLNGATPKSGISDYWNGHIVWVTPADLGNSNEFGIFDSSSLITEDGLNSCGTKLVPPGSIILSTRAPIGSIGIAEVELCTNQGCKSLVPKFANIHTKYFAYYLQSFTKVLNSLGRGTTFMELSTEALSSFIAPYPPLELQVNIANYLDDEIKRINTLIDSKIRLIEVLIELRQSEIDKEFFCGDSTSRPNRLKFSIKTNPGKTINLSDEDEVSFLAMESISELGEIDLSVKKQVKEVLSGYTYFEDGDVTIAKITPCFENGKGAHMNGLLNGVGYGTTELIVIRPSEEVNSDWLYYLTQTHRFRKNGEALMLGSGGQKRVHESYVNNFRVDIPNINVQREIVKNIKKTLTSINKLIEHVQVELELLRELKTKTMTNAVLGKLRI